jgi:hypothetical protein
MIGSTGDRQCPTVVCQVARTAQENQIQDLMTTAIDAVNKVMDLDPACGSTPRHTAATTVATPDQAWDAWWNVLVCALWRAAIDRSDVLGIARGALDRGGADRDLRARAVLRYIRSI